MLVLLFLLKYFPTDAMIPGRTLGLVDVVVPGMYPTSILVLDLEPLGVVTLGFLVSSFVDMFLNPTLGVPNVAVLVT